MTSDHVTQHVYDKGLQLSNLSNTRNVIWNKEKPNVDFVVNFTHSKNPNLATFVPSKWQVLYVQTLKLFAWKFDNQIFFLSFNVKLHKLILTI